MVRTKKEELKTATLDALMQAYKAAAITHRDFSVKDSRKANAAHDEISRIYREVRSRGDVSMKHLIAFLFDEDARVRGWAACHALEFAPREAEAVLQALGNEPGIAGINAQMTLSEWRSGNLKFP